MAHHLPVGRLLPGLYALWALFCRTGAPMRAPGYVPAPPAKVDAPLTRSSARRGSISKAILAGARDCILKEQGTVFQSVLMVLMAGGVVGILPSTLQVDPPAVIVGAVIFYFGYLVCVALQGLWKCHLSSPARWLRANTILARSLFGTIKNSLFCWCNWCLCNTKINCLTRFAVVDGVSQ